MKLSIERLLLIIVAFLVFTASLPTELVFSADGYSESEDDPYELEEEEDNPCLDLENLEEDYDEDEPKTIVTVFHQDEFGNDLLPACIISINESGELYIAISQSEQLPEYDWMRTIGSAVGFHGEDDIEVIFVYRRRPLITITADKLVAYPEDIITYMVVITNEATEMIEDIYTIRVQFDPLFSPVLQLEVILDYLVTGDTIIHFQMAVDQNALAGNKSVKATLVHSSAIIQIDDTEIMTQIEIRHPEDEERIPPRPPEDGKTPPTRPQSPKNGTRPPANEPPINPSEPDDEYDIEVDDEEEEELEDELYNDLEEDVQNQNEPPVDDDFNIEEDVDPEVEEIEVEPTLTMLGTSISDVSILGAIAAVNFKNWRKMAAIRL